MGKILVSKAYCERGYVKYGFDTDARHLPEHIAALSKLLSKGSYMVELFSACPINAAMQKTNPFPAENRGMSYYVFLDVGHLFQMDLSALRFCCICSSETYPSTLTHRSLVAEASFSLCWDNYIRSSELVVRKRDYPNSVLKELYLF